MGALPPPIPPGSHRAACRFCSCLHPSCCVACAEVSARLAQHTGGAGWGQAPFVSGSSAAPVVAAASAGNVAGLRSRSPGVRFATPVASRPLSGQLRRGYDCRGSGVPGAASGWAHSRPPSPPARLPEWLRALAAPRARPFRLGAQGTPRSDLGGVSACARSPCAFRAGSALLVRFSIGVARPAQGD